MMEVGPDGKLYERIGEYELSTPPKPVDREVYLNGDVRKKADQMWARNFPTDREIRRLPLEERKALRRREKRRRRKGVWFFNNGVPTYITGAHYFFLTHYKIDVGYPRYRDADRRFFMVWDYVERSEWCYGLLFITRRQEGKSYKAGCIGLEKATSIPNIHVSAQSKTDEDAKTWFKRAIVNPWKALTYLLRPRDNAKSSDPDKEIRFSAQARMGQHASNAQEVEALDSWIDYANSKFNALDSQKIFFYLNDEIFKKQVGNPLDRWDVVKRMFVQEGKVIAKTLHTSTVEEIEDVGAARAKKLWGESNPAKRDPTTGETKSGMIRYFQSGADGYITDKYGNTDWAQSLARLNAQRKQFIDAGDTPGLLKLMRAYPLTIEEALQTAEAGGTYNNYNINRAIDALDALEKEPWRKVNLTFNDENTLVDFVDNPVNGRFRLIMESLPRNVGQLNAVVPLGVVKTKHGNVVEWLPTADDRACMGSDPYDKSKITNKRMGSSAAAHAFRKWDPLIEADPEHPDYWPTHNFFVEYIERPDDPDTFYEDMVMLCHLLGCKIHIENNKSNIADYFVNRGYRLFLANRPAYTHTEHTVQQQAVGTPSSPLTIGKYVEQTDRFVHRYVGPDWRRLPFKRTLEDLAQFMPGDAENRQKSDASVSVGYTLLDAMKFVPLEPDPIVMEDFNLENIFT